MIRALVIACLIALIAADAGAATTTAPTTNPAILQARRSVRAGKIVEIATRVEWSLGEQARDFAHANPDELIRQATLRVFGRYFARVKEPDEGTVDALAWLVAQPKLAPALMMAVTPFDPPERVLEVLRALRADHRVKLDEFADLAAAMCVVWDAPERFGPEEEAKIDPAAVSRIFAYFATSAAGERLTFDPRRLPPEMLVYVVDLDLNDDELAWVRAQRGGGGRVDVPACFSSVKYFDGIDFDRQRKTPPDDHAYLLPNILTRGGTAADIGYFTIQIARSAGVPAVVSRAVGVGDGAVPVWVGFVAHAGTRPVWDFASARYAEDAGWIGQVTDPQTNEILGEPDASILPALAATPARDRLASMALCKSLDLVPADQRVALLRRAIDLSPANRAAWFALADLAAAGKFDDNAMKPVEESIGKHLRRSPEFAISLRLRMLKGRGSIEFEHGAKRAEGAVADRPDLALIIQLALADRLREDKRMDSALATLTEVLRKGGVRWPAVACAAMSRVDPILRQREEIARLAATYQALFEAIPRPSPSRHGRAAPYYRGIGAKYAEALTDLQKPQEAEAVRIMIQNVVLD